MGCVVSGDVHEVGDQDGSGAGYAHCAFGGGVSVASRKIVYGKGWAVLTSVQKRLSSA